MTQRRTVLSELELIYADGHLPKKIYEYLRVIAQHDSYVSSFTIATKPDRKSASLVRVQLARAKAKLPPALLLESRSSYWGGYRLRLGPTPYQLRALPTRSEINRVLESLPYSRKRLIMKYLRDGLPDWSSNAQIAARLYAKDPDGGPLWAASEIQKCICQLRSLLTERNVPIIVRSAYKHGYRLEYKE